MKKYHLFYLISILMLSCSTSYSSLLYKWCFGPDEEGIKNIVSSCLTKNIDPLEIVTKQDDVIKTKSQAPIKPKTNHASRLVIKGQPVKQHSGCKEVVLKRNSDGRVRITDTDLWPNAVHGVVMVKFSDTDPNSIAWGTGTLIAPQFVLTAAHNLYSRDKFRGKTVGRAISVEFVPAMDGQSAPFKKQNVKNFYYPEQYTIDESEDYGLLALENPIGESTGFFGLGILPDDQISNLEVSIYGYPGDKVKDKSEHYEMWGMKGAVKENDQKLISYEVDTEGGQSGSGVWIEDGQDYLVVGVHILGNLPYNQATLITKNRYDLIQTWMKGFIGSNIYNNVLRDFQLDKLKVIDLSGTYIGDYGVQLLAQSNLNNLDKLMMKRNCISDKAMEILANQPFPKLTVLDLEYNRIGNEGAINILKYLLLTELNLKDNLIDFLNYRREPNIVKDFIKSSTLKTLYIKGNYGLCDSLTKSWVKSQSIENIDINMDVNTYFYSEEKVQSWANTHLKRKIKLYYEKPQPVRRHEPGSMGMNVKGFNNT